ncbi:MAG: hypothetical protein H5U36_00765 [Candidatus Caldatribacterium sp.]|nr:hypothetical protein [Candidatus Caldatribacterium sp.]
MKDGYEGIGVFYGVSRDNIVEEREERYQITPWVTLSLSLSLSLSLDSQAAPWYPSLMLENSLKLPKCYHLYFNFASVSVHIMWDTLQVQYPSGAPLVQREKDKRPLQECYLSSGNSGIEGNRGRVGNGKTQRVLSG